MIDLMLALIAPHICYGCAKTGAVLCSSCMNDIVTDDFGRCIWCLIPAGTSHQCRACRAATTTAGVWVVGERDGVLKTVIDEYKFESRRAAAGQLAELLARTIPVLPDTTVVTWVPTAGTHIRKRGFDHAALLARRFAKLRGLKARCLLKRRHSLSQRGLNGRGRRKAARSAFELLAGDLPACVLLIDDVLTTGATLRACIGLLGEAGVSEMYAAVVARQPLDESHYL